MRRKYFWLLLLLLLVGGCQVWFFYVKRTESTPIKIGVIHSLTGTMAVSEKPLVNAVQLAVEEINRQGGLLGRPVAVVLADGRSEPQVFASEAQRLISQERVSVLFGCWTSASRKAVKPIVEQNRHLLFYPLQYEGLEYSKHIIYTGSAPNQQIIPGARWAMQTMGNKIYLLGSDYVFPRVANKLIRDLVEANNGEIMGEQYLPLGSTDFESVIQEIMEKKPDVILNTLNGDSNAAFFSALTQHGLSDQALVSFSVDENGMHVWHGDQLSRHYGVWSYFQSVDGDENRRFVDAYQRRFGGDQLLSDPIEASYVGVKLWAQAVQQVKSANPEQVNPVLLRQVVKSPSGIAVIDADTRHSWKMFRVGKVIPGGQFSQQFASRSAIRPSIWPNYRSRVSWEHLLQDQ